MYLFLYCHLSRQLHFPLHILNFCHVNWSYSPISVSIMCSFYLHILTLPNSLLTLFIPICYLFFRIQITYHFYTLVNLHYLITLYYPQLRYHLVCHAALLVFTLHSLKKQGLMVLHSVSLLSCRLTWLK